MDDIFFAFAGSGYIFTSEMETIHHGLPSEVVQIVNQKSFGICQSLSTNELGGYFLAWRDRNGRAFNVKSEPLDWQFPEFQSWVSRHDAQNSKLVTCGDSYVGWNDRGRFIWHGVDDSVPQLMKRKGQMKCMALGVEGAFVALWADGTCDWKGLERYTALNELLHASAVHEIEFVALNPNKVGEFFLLFTEKRAAFVVDYFHGEKIRKAVEDRGIEIIIDDAEEWAISLAVVDNDNSSNSLWSYRDSTTILTPTSSSTSSYHDAVSNQLSPGSSTTKEREEPPECPICTEDLGRDGPMNLLAGCESCAQMFHGRCVGEWIKSLKAGNIGSRCPNCRQATSSEFDEQVLAMLI